MVTDEIFITFLVTVPVVDGQVDVVACTDTVAEPLKDEPQVTVAVVPVPEMVLPVPVTDQT